MTLTFVIPVRHQDNSVNWAALQTELADTMGSISRQDCTDWNAVVVANTGAELPPPPARFEILRVDFAPNPHHEKEELDLETFYDAFRIDKGRRVLAGLLHLKPKGHVMIVDHDDFVSRKIASWVQDNAQENGWFLKNGYVWSEGTRLVYHHADFSNVCGTSHIIRSDLYRIPLSQDAASPEYIRRWLGSHRCIHGLMDTTGTPLKELPFPGAVYRVGHRGSFIQSPGVLRMFYWRRELLRRPIELWRRFTRLRPIGSALRNEYFGRDHVGM